MKAFIFSYFRPVFRRVSIRLVLLAVLSGINGCAYHAGLGERQIPGGYRSVAVPVFKNNSQEVGVEVYFTNAFIREMERSRIGIISDKASAQVTLEGTVDSVNYIPTAVTQSGQNFLPDGTLLNSGYRVVVASTLRLRRNSDRKILWEGAFSKELTYQAPQIGYEVLSGANALYNHSARYQKIELIAADMMIEAHDRLTENF